MIKTCSRFLCFKYFLLAKKVQKRYLRTTITAEGAPPVFADHYNSRGCAPSIALRAMIVYMG